MFPKMEGCTISKEEFQALPQKKQMTLLFENTEYIKRAISSNSWKQRVMIGWLSGITAIGAWLAIKLWGIK